MAKDYYSILGVEKNTSPEELKKAYRKLALQYHPDRGGDQEKFKEVNEAYQILSDPQKKAQYDQFGTTGDNFGGFGGFGGGNSQGQYYGAGNFEDMFGGGGFMGDIFESFFGSAFAQVNVELGISLTQAILGDRVRFKTSTGDELELKIPSGTQDGQTFRFRGKGMPYKKGRGDLNVTVRIKFPRHINRRQRELFEELKKTGI